MLRIILAAVLCASSAAYLVSMSDDMARIGQLDGPGPPWALRTALRKMGMDVQRTSAKEAGAEESYFMSVPQDDRLAYRLSGRADDYLAALTANRELGRKVAVIRFLYTTKSALNLPGYERDNGMPPALREAHEVLTTTIQQAYAQIDSEDKSDPRIARNGIASGVWGNSERMMREAGASIRLQAMQERASTARRAAVRTFLDTTLSLLPPDSSRLGKSTDRARVLPLPFRSLYERMALRLMQSQADEAKSLSDFGKSLRGALDEPFAADLWYSTGIGPLVEQKRLLAKTNAVQLFCMATRMNALPENTETSEGTTVPVVLKNQLSVLQAQIADQEVQRRLEIKFQRNSSPSGGAPSEPNTSYAELAGKKRDTEYEKAFYEFAGCTVNMTCDEALGRSAPGGQASCMAFAQAYARLVGNMVVADDDTEMRRITTLAVNERPRPRPSFNPSPGGGLFPTDPKTNSVFQQIFEKYAQDRLAAEQDPRTKQLREFYAERDSSKKLLAEEFIGTTATTLRVR